MCRNNNSEDGDCPGCFGFLASWIPGLRYPAKRCMSQDRSTFSSCSSGSMDTKGASNDVTDVDDESPLSEESRSSSTGSWSSMGDLQTTESAESDAPSEESDPQERVRRATASFLQWKNKEYVPLSPDEKRAIKEYRKTVAQEEGTYTSTRAQRQRGGAPKELISREDEWVDLGTPVEDGGLVRRRNRKIRFVAAVIASKEVDVHNDGLVVVTDTGEEVPELPRCASILRTSCVKHLTEEPPVFVEDLNSCMLEEEGQSCESALCVPGVS
ncbi:hypothetical protein, unknown function [Leishmania donovani]|uniref:Uncharacterized protein n=1 Tax=Leishmania donovani TaxID=5661 RepID=A0A3Q8IF41_LEIDO|nr:hypothetical protein, unknown function [Leishmania donovani]AYU81497.1 hypothetical protein LdCL_310037300 [Leishmania donovani]TPP42482.1 hypothetical protein CGC21_10835 [Leishmania donovani]CBZ36688.1 hypothetical protein, unknown function [Leishmania donovani]